MNLISLLLAFYPAIPQISHGSLGVVYFTQDKIIVAADSRAIFQGVDRPPADDQCKIAASDREFVFVSAGTGAYPGRPPWIPSWNNTEEMLSSYRRLRARFGSLQGHALDVAIDWSTVIRERFSQLYTFDRAAFLDASKETGNLTVAFLGGLNAANELGLYEIVVASSGRLDNPVSVAVTPVDCAPSNFCAVGRTEVFNEFDDMTSERAKRANALQAVNDDDETAPGDDDIKRSIRFVDLTIQYQDGITVGGPVDAVELDIDGRIRWYRRKDNCPERE